MHESVRAVSTQRQFFGLSISEHLSCHDLPDFKTYSVIMANRGTSSKP